MRFKFFSKDEISRLPKGPGIYCFKDKKRKFLYFGKAINIKERVKNHFHSVKYREAVILPKAKLFNRVKKIGYLKTDSEIEALILEANLIKKYQPKYNVVWRDDKNYFFVGITKEDFPRIFWTHQTNIKSQFIGPFVDGKALKQVLKILRKVFPYRTCKTLPNRPCLWYQLQRCPAPCLIKSTTPFRNHKFLNSTKSSLLYSSKEMAEFENFFYRKMKKECQDSAKNLIKILQGRKVQVLKDLKKEMKKDSLSENFEKAAKIRDQIGALKRVLEHGKIFSLIRTTVIKKPWQNYYSRRGKIEKELGKLLKTKKRISRIEAYDVSNIAGQEATGSMVTFIDGQPAKNFYRKFKIKIAGKPNDLAMIKEILSRRFKHQEWGLPDLILIDGGKAQLNVAQSTINNQQLTIPVIALAKKENKLFVEGQKKPILLKNLPREIFNLILQLRDEAHRFARQYHLKLREMKLRP